MVKSPITADEPVGTLAEASVGHLETEIKDGLSTVKCKDSRDSLITDGITEKD